MEFTYENYGTNTYLVYEIQPTDKVDTMSLGMLTNNKIDGLAPVIYTQMDTRKFLKYNVTAKVSVEQFFQGPVNKKRLTGVFRGMVNAMLSAEEYMIQPDSILLDMEYLFTDVSTCETVLICLPIVQKRPATDLGALFKNIVFNTQFDKTESCDYVANIINYLNSSGAFSLEDFMKVLEEIEGTGQTQVRSERAKEMSQPVRQMAQPAAAPQAHTAVSPQQIPANPSIPSYAAPRADGPQPAMADPEAEKQISMLTLLTHYSKENKELYKHQKEAKKQGKQGKSKHEAAMAQNTFAIPGQPAPQNVAAARNDRLPQQQKMPSQAVPVPPRSSAPPRNPVVQQGMDVRVQQPGGVKANFGETVVLNAGMQMGETTVLGATDVQAEKRPYLIRTKNHEKIYVDKPVFRIGKEKSYVDYFIGDNTAISRSHANIINREQTFYIVDTNSTNHTYVEDRMIQSNAETQIRHGTKFRLANEEFEFYLY